MLKMIRGWLITAKKVWFLSTTDKQLVYGEIYGIRTHVPITELSVQSEWSFFVDRVIHKETYYTKENIVFRESTYVFKLPDGTVFNTAAGFLNGQKH